MTEKKTKPTTPRKPTGTVGTKKKGRTGRPSKIQERYKKEVELLALVGMTVPEMAAFWNVAPSTVNRWMTLDKDFSEAIKHGREKADTNVEKSLYKRACGFEYTEREYTGIGNAMTLTKKRTKQVAPDVGAICFFLKNRKPKKWRDRKELEVSGDERRPLALILTTEPSNGGEDGDDGESGNGPE